MKLALDQPSTKDGENVDRHRSTNLEQLLFSVEVWMAARKNTAKHTGKKTKKESRRNIGATPIYTAENECEYLLVPKQKKMQYKNQYHI